MGELMKLYHALIADALIMQHVDSQNIKFYEYPETGNFSGTVIILDPLSEPIQSVFGDDEAIAEDILIQVDVWSKDATSTEVVAKRIAKLFREIGYNYSDAGPKEYDKGIFRSVRRYTGRYYTEEFTGAQ